MLSGPAFPSDSFIFPFIYVCVPLRPVGSRCQGHDNEWTECPSSWSAQLREETGKHIAQAERSWDAAEARRGPRSGQEQADLPPGVKGAKQGGVGFLDGGDSQAGCPEARTTDLWVSQSSYKQSALHNKGDLFSDVTEKSRPREGGSHDQIGT